MSPAKACQCCVCPNPATETLESESVDWPVTVPVCEDHAAGLGWRVTVMVLRRPDKVQAA